MVFQYVTNNYFLETNQLLVIFFSYIISQKTIVYIYYKVDYKSILVYNIVWLWRGYGVVMV